MIATETSLPIQVSFHATQRCRERIDPSLTPMDVRKLVSEGCFLSQREIKEWRHNRGSALRGDNKAFVFNKDKDVLFVVAVHNDHLNVVTVLNRKLKDG